MELDATGEPTHRYLWGPAVDMLLADESISPGTDEIQGTADDVHETFWTLVDNQNSVRDILVFDDAADQWAIGNHITYDTSGNVVSETGAADCFFEWTGRPRDNWTGNLQVRARWYDPVAGEWLSLDPSSFAAGDANLYRYCGNDPVNHVDPSGLETAKKKTPTLSDYRKQQRDLELSHVKPDTPTYYKLHEKWFYDYRARQRAKAEIGVAADYADGKIPLFSQGEGIMYLKGIPQAAKGYFIDGPCNIVVGAYGAVKLIVTRGPEGVAEDIGAALGTLIASPEARKKVAEGVKKGLNEALDDPEKGGAIAFEVVITVLAPEEAIANAAKIKYLKGVKYVDDVLLEDGRIARIIVRESDEVADALHGASRLDNGASFGASFFDDLALQATKNPNSTKVVLGQFSKTGQSYQKAAAHLNATYFKLDNWRALEHTLSKKQLWKINEAFLEQQIKSGKQILLTSDPAMATGSFLKEVQFLRRLGYRFVKDGWIWRVVK